MTGKCQYDSFRYFNKKNKKKKKWGGDTKVFVILFLEICSFGPNNSNNMKLKEIAGAEEPYNTPPPPARVHTNNSLGFLSEILRKAFSNYQIINNWRLSNETLSTLK